jgi:hypothetical protein
MDIGRARRQLVQRMTPDAPRAARRHPCCSAIGTEITSGLNVREPKMDDFAEQE